MRRSVEIELSGAERSELERLARGRKVWRSLSDRTHCLNAVLPENPPPHPGPPPVHIPRSPGARSARSCAPRAEARDASARR